MADELKQTADGGWELVSDNNTEMWNPEEPGSELSLSGKLVNIRTEVGVNKSMIYEFENEKGEKKSVWGSTVLDGKMKEVELGTLCKIEFLGRKPNKSGSGKPYKNWEVYTKK